MTEAVPPVVSGILPDSHAEEVRTYRGNLPHWRVAGAAYLVTWRLWSHQESLEGAERAQVVSALLFFQQQRYFLHAYVVMDDHVHVIVQPFDGVRLERIIQSWKSFTSKSLIRQSARTAPIWQDEYFDRVIRDEHELLEKIHYVLDNPYPYRRWGEIAAYEWAGVGN